MKIIPIGENILLKPDKIEEKTDTGLVMPESVERPVLFGIIEAWGEDTPTILQNSYGIKVAYAKYNAGASEIGEFILINWHDIMGIIDENE